MVTPKTSRPASTREESVAQRDLESELRQAERDFENGDFIELTVEELDRSTAAAEWPWRDDASSE